MIVFSVSLVDGQGQVLYDSLAHIPSDTIIDYQTRKSGIQEGSLEDGMYVYSRLVCRLHLLIY
jgi:hypothetical protein